MHRWAIVQGAINSRTTSSANHSNAVHSIRQDSIWRENRPSQLLFQVSMFSWWFLSHSRGHINRTIIAENRLIVYLHSTLVYCENTGRMRWLNVCENLYIYSFRVSFGTYTLRSWRHTLPLIPISEEVITCTEEMFSWTYTCQQMFETRIKI